MLSTVLNLIDWTITFVQNNSDVLLLAVIGIMYITDHKDNLFKESEDAHATKPTDSEQRSQRRSDRAA